MSSKRRFLGCLDNIDFDTVNEFLSPPESELNNSSQLNFTPEEFNDFIEKKYSNNDLCKYLSCIHVNTRSLCRNFDALSLFLSSLSVQTKVVGITETWLSDNSPVSLCNIHGYEFVGNNRKSKRGGGVGLYVHKDISFNRRCDLDINTDFLESIFVEITNYSTSMLICVMYRPPDQSVNEFCESLNNILDVVKREKKTFYLMGDFNIDLLKVGHVQYANDFVDLLLLNCMVPLIHYPTRVTESSASLLDNIFTNDSCQMQSGVILTDISDHFPVYCVCESEISSSTNEQNKKKRDINENNIRIFLQSLESTEWKLESDNPNNNYNNFIELFLDKYNNSFPLISTYHKRRIKDNPWCTKDIRKLIKKKCKMYKLYIKNPTSYRKNLYKKYRNEVTNKIKLAKKEYYKNKLNNANRNSKKTWDVINTALGKKCNKKTTIKCLKFNNKIIENKKEICNSLNTFFANVGHDINSSFCDSRESDYLRHVKNVDSSAFFKPITCKEIIDFVSNLKNDTSAGYDGIEIQIIKRSIHLICKPLCAIFNQCIELGIFPEKLKIARVVPVFKSGSPDVMTNYRPISVLPVFSKILEKCISTRLVDFLTKCNIIKKNQYGFRAGHSTSSALIDFIHKVISAIENGEVLLGLFLDLSKAFDTLDHNILLAKLHKYGIRGALLNLFKSYLNNRKQFVCIDDNVSEYKSIRCGVPQGSILGPILFILYINDLPNVSDILKCILFADDTSIFFSHDNVDSLQEIFNQELQSVTKWLKVNKLLINVSKTNFMIFTKKKCNLDNICVNMCDSRIKQVSSLKFLGIIVDNKLNWSNHINFISNKLSKNIGIMNRLNCLPRSVLKLIYNTIVLPHLYYGITVWGNAHETYINRLQVLQKRAIRIISHASFLAHTQPLFSSLKILRLNDMYKYQAAIFMYLCTKQLLPQSLLELFSFNNQVHNYNTRSASNFHIPLSRTSFYQRSIIYNGPILWNSLPCAIRNTKSLNTFKRSYKKNLLGDYI